MVSIVYTSFTTTVRPLVPVKLTLGQTFAPDDDVFVVYVIQTFAVCPAATLSGDCEIVQLTRATQPGETL
jgi:hypothetical protein